MKNKENLNSISIGSISLILLLLICVLSASAASNNHGYDDSEDAVKNKKPVANFSTNVTEGYAPFDVQFTDLSEYATGWNWEFGDGSNDSTNKSPAHSYTVPGTYNVNLTITNEKGTDSKFATITVLEKPATVVPVANFNIKVSGYAPLYIQFTSQSENTTGLIWEFGDGSDDSTYINPTHLYTIPGTYNVSLTSINGTKSTFATITVLEKPGIIFPIANFSSNITEGYTPLSVQFTDMSENATEINWDFENDGTIDSTDRDPIYKYTSSGNYTVNLTVSNENGTDSKLVTITALEQPAIVIPEANFSANVTEGYAPLSVQFTDLSINATERDWEFGDGNNSTDETPFYVYAVSGTYNVSLTVVNENGTDSRSIIVTVLEKPDPIFPVADFSTNVTSGYAPLFVQFTDLSGNATERNWDIDNDGIADYNDESFSHLYENPGNYTANLTAINGNGTDSKLVTVTVLEKPEPVIPVANFSINVTEGYAPLSVQFTDLSQNATGWDWSFGDGNNSTQQNPTHTYFTTGNYTVNMTTSNGNGTDSKFIIITILDKPEPAFPVANFSSNVTSGYIPLSVQFNDSSANVTEWNWDFGDGINSTEQNPIHNYSVAGNYTVNLTVSNGNGTNSKFAEITASVKPETSLPAVPVVPVANFSTNLTEGYAPLSIQFTDSSKNATGWKWYFGDGTNSTEQNPVHTYNKTGKYTITLTANNAAGSNTIAKYGYLNITSDMKIPVADFSVSQTSGTTPVNISFTDNSTGSPKTWKWYFGDGTNSTEQNPVHTYNKTGKYTVSLTVTNPMGANTITKNNQIILANDMKIPVADFFVSQTSGSAPQNISFTDNSTGLPTGWKWYFGDGTNSTEQNPVHTYNKTGKYTVTLTVNNMLGTNTIAKYGYINLTNEMRTPEADFSASQTSGSAPQNISFTDNSTGLPAAWKWYFGDGTNSTEQNPAHTYNKTGKYTVSLTVSNLMGSNTETKYSYISLTDDIDVPVVDFSATPVSGNSPLEVSFTDSSKGSPTSWKWNFGDGTYSTEQNPVHTYSQAGKYSVSLTVNNLKGSNSVARYRYITVSKSK